MFLQTISLIIFKLTWRTFCDKIQKNGIRILKRKHLNEWSSYCKENKRNCRIPYMLKNDKRFCSTSLEIDFVTISMGWFLVGTCRNFTVLRSTSSRMWWHLMAICLLRSEFACLVVGEITDVLSVVAYVCGSLSLQQNLLSGINSIKWFCSQAICFLQVDNATHYALPSLVQ